MLTAPDHIKEYCVCSEITESLNDFKGEYSYVYQIKCQCGCENFLIYTNDWPKAVAVCPECNNEITVYDLHLYPASAPRSYSDTYAVSEIVYRFEGYDEVSLLENSTDCKLLVNYQYSDEYALTDAEFNMNNITGFNMWTYSNGICELVIDDETA